MLLLLGVGSSLWIGVPAYRQHLAIQEIIRRNGLVDSRPLGPKWLRDLLGERLMRPFEEVDEVFLYHDEITDATLWRVSLLRPKKLILDDTPVTPTGLAHLEGMTTLKTLYLERSESTDAGMIHLKALTNLDWLLLGGNPGVTDAGLAHLSGLIGLRALALDDTQVTDAGLAHLKRLANLEILWLSDTQVTDAGLAHLNGLTRLKELWVVNTRVTDDGATELERALPGLRLVRQRIETDWGIIPPIVD
jgi:hypothetical protein